MPDPDRDILDLIEAGNKIGAIKLAREHLGMGLAEAKAFVEGLERDAGGGGAEHRTSSSGARTGSAAGEPIDDELDGLLRAKRKIDAVKLYRGRAGCGLKDAKDAIEARAVELGLQSRPSKCFIATAACGGGEQADVATLRRFRNRVLRSSAWGRALVAAYELASPPAAWIVARHEPTAASVRWVLRAVVRGVGRR